LAFKFKQLIAGFFFFALSFSGGTSFLFANPYEELTSDQPLYQRVKKLENYGLLNSADKAVLDQGEAVTRLQLAFYVQKAKAQIEDPELLHPTPSPVITPVLSSPIITPPPAEATIAVPQPVIAPLPVPTALPEPINPAVRQEIENLLQEFKQESAVLRARMSIDDQLLGKEAKEIDTLKDLQNDANSIWGKANASTGVPSFNAKTRFRFEDLNMSGLETINAIRPQNELDLGMWSDLGGTGSISLGIIAVTSASNASAASEPVSVNIYNPDVNFKLTGPLGQWDTHFAVEAYPGALTFGDFSRSLGPTSLRNFVDPVDIKRFSDDKDSLTWDSYMDAFTLAPPLALAGAIVSSTDPVFDGLYGVGTNVPLLGPDGRLIVLLGRQGTDATQPDRFEEGVKLSEPFGPVYANLSTEWVNDDFGYNRLPELDLKTYQADFTVNLSPVIINVEGAFSSLYSGLNNGVPTNTALEAPAGQIEASFYPFNIFYTAISDGFANFNSKVAMAGVNFAQYGVQQGPIPQANQNLNQYGLIGEVDDLVSDRYGWRVNLGWDGRKQDWMKKWPSFLDSILINFNVAKKTEYAVETNAEGYNVIEAFNVIQPYYPDDEGIWGLDLWGGYTPPWQPAREAYNGNIEALRNDGDTNDDQTRYNFDLSSEIIPLIMPVANEPVSEINGKPVTIVPGTPNTYVNITDLKTYNYVQLNVKWKINKAFGFDKPLYSSFYFADNEVSGQATQVGQTSIPNLFEQQVYDISAMYQIIPNVNLMADYGWETWNSSYTYPLINYRTTAPGIGIAYDIPWGGGRFDLRYKDVTFTDIDVPANSYHTGQWYSELFFLF
jgi:hypothetical protein